MKIFSNFFGHLIWNFHRFFFKINHFHLLLGCLFLLPLGIKIYINVPLKEYIEYKKLNTIKSELTNIQLKPLITENARSQDILKDFHSFLPKKSKLDNDLFRIKKLISENNLEKNVINYDYVLINDIDSLNVKMNLKLKGTYIGQRNFIYNLLSEFPYLSIPKIIIKSDNDQIFESDMILSLYYTNEQKIDSR